MIGDPIIGQAYEVNYDATENDLALGGNPNEVVPVGQSDQGDGSVDPSTISSLRSREDSETGNLVVHNYGGRIEDEPRIVEWQPGAFAEYVEMGVLENRNN